MEVLLIARLLKGELVELPESGLSEREWKEFTAKFGLKRSASD
jgi:hypothetical protein